MYLIPYQALEYLLFHGVSYFTGIYLSLIQRNSCHNTHSFLQHSLFLYIFIKGLSSIICILLLLKYKHILYKYLYYNCKTILTNLLLSYWKLSFLQDERTPLVVLSINQWSLYLIRWFIQPFQINLYKRMLLRLSFNLF